MKRYALNCFLVIVLCFLSNISHAQYWAPVGAEWHYDKPEWEPPFGDQYVKITSVKDTIVKGFNANILDLKVHSVIYPNTWGYKYITRYEDRVVYLYNTFVDSFMTLYDFNLGIGDTMISYLSEHDTAASIVDTIQYRVYNGDTLKSMWLTPISTTYILAGWTTERIGNSYQMFPEYFIADPPLMGPLRCYQDTALGLQQFVSYDCDWATGVEEFTKEEKIEISPNPNSGSFSLYLNDFEGDLLILNGEGKLVRRNSISFLNRYFVDLDVPPGFYYLRLISKEGNSYGNRIIIE